MKKKSKCIKCIISAGVSIYAIVVTVQALGSFTESFRNAENINLAEGLLFGMQTILVLTMLTLCMVVAENIVKLIFTVREQEEETKGEAWYKMLKVKLLLNSATKLMFALSFMILGVYVIYTAAIGMAGIAFYVTGVFFIIVAGIITFNILKRIVLIIKSDYK